MNLVVLCVVLPFAALLFVLAVMFTRRLHRMSTSEFADIWGGLYRKPHIYVWCLTYVLSGLGGILTFYLHVEFTTADNVLPMFIFVCVNISYITWIYAVERRNRDVVAVCLFMNVLCYFMLFLYTLLLFPIHHAIVANETLLYITHFCNAVTIFHVLVMDLYYWNTGWVRNYE